MTIWVLVANASMAKLYKSSNLRTDTLHFFHEYNHPDSRRRALDLTSDKPGRYRTDSAIGSSYEHGDPKKLEAEHFALELIKEIKTHCNFEDIKSLIIVAPDSLYKFITKHHLDVNSHHKDKIMHVAKDYTKYSLKELEAALKDMLLV